MDKQIRVNVYKSSLTGGSFEYVNREAECLRTGDYMVAPIDTEFSPIASDTFREIMSLSKEVNAVNETLQALMDILDSLKLMRKSNQ